MRVFPGYLEQRKAMQSIFYSFPTWIFQKRNLLNKVCVQIQTDKVVEDGRKGSEKITPAG